MYKEELHYCSHTVTVRDTLLISKFKKWDNYAKLKLDINVRFLSNQFELFPHYLGIVYPLSPGDSACMLDMIMYAQFLQLSWQV